MREKNKRLDADKVIATAAGQNLSIAKLGEKAGFNDRNYIWARLKGKTSMTVDEYATVCEVLGAEPGFFLKS